MKKINLILVVILILITLPAFIIGLESALQEYLKIKVLDSFIYLFPTIESAVFPILYLFSMPFFGVYFLSKKQIFIKLYGVLLIIFSGNDIVHIIYLLFNK